jgi:hypothetical protein
MGRIFLAGAPRTSQNGLAARSTVAKRPGRSGLGVVGLAQHCAWPSHAGRARHGAASPVRAQCADMARPVVSR